MPLKYKCKTKEEIPTEHLSLYAEREGAWIAAHLLIPWPGGYVLPAAEKNGVKLIARVVDYGGLFHDDVKPGH